MIRFGLPVGNTASLANKAMKRLAVFDSGWLTFKSDAFKATYVDQLVAHCTALEYLKLDDSCLSLVQICRILNADHNKIRKLEFVAWVCPSLRPDD